jgi:hypothetical protein
MPVIDEGGSLILSNATNDIFAVQVLHDKVEQANHTEPPLPTVPNKDFKQSGTIKAITYGIKPNEIQVRLTNLQDGFDGNYSKPLAIDLNAWAREFYLEANAHLMVPKDSDHMSVRNSSIDVLEGVILNITEMNLAGSVPLCQLSNQDLNNTRRWFNWTTSMEDNPDDDHKQTNDTEVVVPLPTKNSKTNETLVNLLNMTTPGDTKPKVAADLS